MTNLPVQGQGQVQPQATAGQAQAQGVVQVQGQNQSQGQVQVLTQGTQVSLSDAQFNQLLQGHSNSAPATVDTPRCGGVDSLGAWTGGGKNGNPNLPADPSNCYRAVKSNDVLKSAVYLNPIKSKCEKGLSDHASRLLFSTEGEPGANNFVACLKAFEDACIKCGIEDIFKIRTQDPNSKPLNMFQEPGLVTPDRLKTWHRDLTIDGVWDTSDPNNIKRHPLCTYDIMNLSIGGEAVLNSCTEGLKQRLKEALSPASRNGLELLYDLFGKCYRPSSARVETLKTELKAMDIRKYPGENITSFCADAMKIVREIRLNFLLADQVPDLTMIVLNGLTHSSDQMIRNKAREDRLNSSKVGFGRNVNSKILSPIDLLNEYDDLYRRLCDSQDYAPAQTKPSAAAHQASTEFKALQSQMQNIQKSLGQLQQDRNATSTTGNRRRPSNEEIRNRQDNPSSTGSDKEGRCYRCGEPGH